MYPPTLDDIVPLYRMQNGVHQIDRESKKSILANLISPEAFRDTKYYSFFVGKKKETELEFNDRFMQALGQSPVSSPLFAKNKKMMFGASETKVGSRDELRQNGSEELKESSQQQQIKTELNSDIKTGS